MYKMLVHILCLSFFQTPFPERKAQKFRDFTDVLCSYVKKQLRISVMIYILRLK